MIKRKPELNGSSSNVTNNLKERGNKLVEINNYSSSPDEQLKMQQNSDIENQNNDLKLIDTIENGTQNLPNKLISASNANNSTNPTVGENENKNIISKNPEEKLNQKDGINTLNPKVINDSLKKKQKKEKKKTLDRKKEVETINSGMVKNELIEKSIIKDQNIAIITNENKGEKSKKTHNIESFSESCSKIIKNNNLKKELLFNPQEIWCNDKVYMDAFIKGKRRRIKIIFLRRKRLKKPLAIQGNGFAPKLKENKIILIEKHPKESNPRNLRLCQNQEIEIEEFNDIDEYQLNGANGK